MEDNKWLLATFAASLCWAAADVLNDACIKEAEEEDEEGGAERSSDDDGLELAPLSRSNSNDSDDEDASGGGDGGGGSSSSSSTGITKRRTNSGKIATRRSPKEGGGVGGGIGGGMGGGAVRDDVEAALADVRTGDAASKARDGKLDALGAESDDEEETTHLVGDQNLAVGGLSTGLVMYILSLKRVHLHKNAVHYNAERGAPGPLSPAQSPADGPQLQFIWSPSHDLEWWMAAVGGILMFLHFFYLLRAYDGAPSTVINPLIQVSSTWMLLGSAVPAMMAGTTFIRPFDLFCYCIIVAGGIMPSLGPKGDVKTMMSLKFWRKGYVFNTVVSEVTIGMYDLVMSFSIQNSAKKEKFRNIAPSDLEFEFFFIAWCGFVVCFCSVFALTPSLRQKLIDLRDVPKKMSAFASTAQLLTLAGFYMSQYAYLWYYQASIVHAAEASLSQGLNLFFAIIAFKLFGLGRASAVENLGIKALSCVVVSIGLFLLSSSEAGDDSAAHAHAHAHGVDDVAANVHVIPPRALADVWNWNPL